MKWFPALALALAACPAFPSASAQAPSSGPPTFEFLGSAGEDDVRYLYLETTRLQRRGAVADGMLLWVDGVWGPSDLIWMHYSANCSTRTWEVDWVSDAGKDMQVPKHNARPGADLGSSYLHKQHTAQVMAAACDGKRIREKTYYGVPEILTAHDLELQDPPASARKGHLILVDLDEPLAIPARPMLSPYMDDAGALLFLETTQVIRRSANAEIEFWSFTPFETQKAFKTVLLEGQWTRHKADCKSLRSREMLMVSADAGARQADARMNHGLYRTIQPTSALGQTIKAACGVGPANQFATLDTVAKAAQIGRNFFAGVKKRGVAPPAKTDALNRSPDRIIP